MRVLGEVERTPSARGVSVPKVGFFAVDDSKLLGKPQKDCSHWRRKIRVRILDGDAQGLGLSRAGLLVRAGVVSVKPKRRVRCDG